MDGKRDGRIDLFRGLALLFIFWDHIPDNVIGLLTPRNFGFSDAAEIFVFLAGYGAALAYGRGLGRDGWAASCMRILRRAWKLYVAHIFILVVLAGIVFVANQHVESRDFVEELHLTYLVKNTEPALIDALTLRFKPGLMDPLPLYIVLLLAFAVCLPAVVRRPGLALAGSAILYGLTRHFDWQMPSAPREGWFFNPLAWQLLFILGAVCATGLGRALSPRLRRACLAPAAGFLAVAALLALSWRWPEVHDAVMPPWLADLIYPIDKTNLGLLRLLHFLALACCVSVLVPAGAWLGRPVPSALRLLGRHSLEVFCLGVVLAPLADAGNALLGNHVLAQVATSAAGAALMVAFATGLELSRPAVARPAAQAVGK